MLRTVPLLRRHFVQPLLNLNAADAIRIISVFDFAIRFLTFLSDLICVHLILSVFPGLHHSSKTFPCSFVSQCLRVYSELEATNAAVAAL